MDGTGAPASRLALTCVTGEFWGAFPLEKGKSCSFQNPLSNPLSATDGNLLQPTTSLYHNACPATGPKRNTVKTHHFNLCTPPICIATLLPFVLQCFWEGAGVGVASMLLRRTGTPPAHICLVSLSSCGHGGLQLLLAPLRGGQTCNN